MFGITWFLLAIIGLRVWSLQRPRDPLFEEPWIVRCHVALQTDTRESRVTYLLGEPDYVGYSLDGDTEIKELCYFGRIDPVGNKYVNVTVSFGPDGKVTGWEVN
jgi:hypothetical protein